jgi:hypothetical protein
VGHVGEELRLVAAGRFEKASLVLDLVEEPGILNGKRGLCGEGSKEIDDLRRELARLIAVYHQTADEAVFPQERYDEETPDARRQKNSA